MAKEHVSTLTLRLNEDDADAVQELMVATGHKSASKALLLAARELPAAMRGAELGRFDLGTPARDAAGNGEDYSPVVDKSVVVCFGAKYNAAVRQDFIEGSACAVAPSGAHRSNPRETVAIRLSLDYGPMLREPVHVELMGARWTILALCPAVQHRDADGRWHYEQVLELGNPQPCYD